MTVDASSGPDLIPALKLDALIAKLNELHRTASLEYFLRIGRLIVTEIYASDLTRWRMNKEREISFRQLAARTQVDLRMSVTSLYRAVALYELCSRLPVELWRDFGAGHLRAVLGLRKEEQVRLLSAAKAKDWTARQLYAETKQGRTRTVKNRPYQPSIVRLMRQLLSKLRDTPALANSFDAEGLAALVRDLRQALGRLEPVSSLDRHQTIPGETSRFAGSA